jgi:hypothetical protein
MFLPCEQSGLHLLFTMYLVCYRFSRGLLIGGNGVASDVYVGNMAGHYISGRMPGGGAASPGPDARTSCSKRNGGRLGRIGGGRPGLRQGWCGVYDKNVTKMSCVDIYVTSWERTDETGFRTASKWPFITETRRTRTILANPRGFVTLSVVSRVASDVWSRQRFRPGRAARSEPRP